MRDLSVLPVAVRAELRTLEMNRSRAKISKSIVNLPAILIAGLFIAGGCSGVKDFFKTDVHRLLSPDKVIAPPETGSPINPIYDTIGAADTTHDLFPNATFPREGDWEYVDTDYLIGPADIVSISVLDLFAEGMEATLQRTVSASGYISLPLLEERIKAEGLSVDELREAVAEAYRPGVLRNPIVSVVIAAQRQSWYSIMGAVENPGQYPIIRKDLRLSQAIAAAGDITQANIDYIYVFRPAPAIRRRVEPPKPKAAPPEPLRPEELPELPPEAPPEVPPPTQPRPETVPETVPATRPEQVPPIEDIEAALRELGALAPGRPREEKPPTRPVPSVVPHLTELSEIVAGGGNARGADNAEQEVKELEGARSPRFIYTSEGWVRVDQEAGVATKPSGEGAAPVRPLPAEPREARRPTEEREEDPYGWRELDKSGLVRIIAINLNKLRAGDQRQDVIIRDNDVIQVPPLQMGEFYIMGEVQRPGVYTLTGRKLTVKQAVVAAGNLGMLAWPENALLTRRIGNNQEQTIALNLEAIFRGEEADIFLKPNDIIAVGTDVRSIFYAVMRNAFRMTYGFGFIYDRNFANPYTIPLDSKRFTRW